MAGRFLRLIYTLQVTIIQIWNDNRLTWNTSQFENIKIVYYPKSELWTPPIKIENDISDSDQFGESENLLILQPNGDVLWPVTQTSKFSCEIDITFYPFDIQRCYIKLWFYPISPADLVARTNEPPHPLAAIRAHDFQSGGTWETVDIRCDVTVDQHSGQNQRLSYEFVLRRRTTHYILNIVLPVVFLSMTASLVFILPAEAGEKMGVSITVLLTYSVYLSIIADDLPQTSTQLCHLQVYLTSLLGVTAMAVVLSVAVLNLHHRPPTTAVGHNTRRAVLILRKLVCFETQVQNVPATQYVKGCEHCSNDTNGNLVGRRPQEDSAQTITWCDVATVVDRLLFTVFSVIITAGTVVVFTYLTQAGDSVVGRNLSAPLGCG